MNKRDWSDWISPAEAAKKLGVTPQRIRQLADEGTITSTRTPLGRLLDTRSVEALVEKRKAYKEKRR